jgi:N-acetylmuramoyl-L-alanine amidase
VRRARAVSCAVALAAAFGALPASAGPERFDRVVIDAGHGGDDHGAEGPAGLREKDLVLDLAQRLARKLRAQGLGVHFTRSADAFVALDERTAIANRSAGDLFVSIHANASRAASARGIETYFASPEASDEAAEELARAENAAFGPAAAKLTQGDPLLSILGDLLAQQQLADSQEFARLAQREIARGTAARSRGVKQAPFVVLMGVRMPAVLVEVGFLTNPLEEKTLRRHAERERIAGGLARAIAAFRARQDERSGVAHASAGGAR